MSTAATQIPAETASVTAQMTNHIMRVPPLHDGSRVLRMMFKFCHEEANASPCWKELRPSIELPTAIRQTRRSRGGPGEPAPGWIGAIARGGSAPMIAAWTGFLGGLRAGVNQTAPLARRSSILGRLRIGLRGRRPNGFAPLGRIGELLIGGGKLAVARPRLLQIARQALEPLGTISEQHRSGCFCRHGLHLLVSQ